jgi:transcriptional regulator with XRE-family HTH domain
VSIDISNNIFVKANAVRYILHPMNMKESLPDYIRRVMSEGGITFRKITERSRGEISGAYVSDLISGKAANPSVEKIVALAKGLNRPEQELFQIARGKSKPSDDPDFRQSIFYMIYEKSQAASPEMKQVVNRVLGMIDRELDEEDLTVPVNQLADERAAKKKRA